MSFVLVTRRLFLATGVSALGVARLALPERPPALEEPPGESRPACRPEAGTPPDRALFFLFGCARGR